jgi:hypothetical protein
MGAYIPDPEMFLAQHGLEIKNEALFEAGARAELRDPRASRVPVVMADNGSFQAAIIIVDDRELNRVLQTIDDRPWRFFFVERQLLAPFLPKKMD